jgi:hypothetical protein
LENLEIEMDSIMLIFLFIIPYTSGIFNNHCYSRFLGWHSPRSQERKGVNIEVFVGSEGRRALKRVACTQGFSKPALGTKGPVDLLEGFK